MHISSFASQNTQRADGISDSRDYSWGGWKEDGGLGVFPHERQNALFRGMGDAG